jgi:signal transduction histidine kinase
VNADLFGSDLWKPALDKYAEATGLSVRMFDVDARVVVNSMYPTPLVALFREYGVEPDLFAECARACVGQVAHRPVITADESHGLTVVGTALLLEGEIVGAAVAGYALSRFCQVPTVHRWARSAGIPFDRLWNIVRQQPPVAERRLLLRGGLLQVLGDALLRENYRTRQFEDTVVKLESASAAKDEFLAVLSHELRTPLAAIAGWASMLKKSVNLEQMHRAAGAIERNAFLQNRMVDDLLDMSSIAQGHVTLDLEVLELAACVRAALETTAQNMEAKAIQLDFLDADEPLFVDGDAGRLQQIFRNILSNAAKFTPAGGSIRVSLSRDAGHALVVVADTGKGIAPEFLPFAFDIFRQQEQGATRGYEGLGIGLSLVKKLTELHKGTVSLTSTGAGLGTEVTVRLPLAAKIPALDEAAPSAGALAKPIETG